MIHVVVVVVEQHVRSLAERGVSGISSALTSSVGVCDPRCGPFFKAYKETAPMSMIPYRITPAYRSNQWKVLVGPKEVADLPLFGCPCQSVEVVIDERVKLGVQKGRL